MSQDAAARTIAADAVAADTVLVALHTGDPGGGAANEVTGGGYVRQSASWDAAASGVAALADTLAFDVPAVTITHITAWDAAGTTRHGVHELGAPEVFPVAGVFRITGAELRHLAP